MGKSLISRIRTMLRASGPKLAVPLEEMPAGTIGRGTYGGSVSVHHFTVNGGLKVGAYCSFAAEVEILLGGNHRHDWVTTYPFPNRDARYAHLPPSAATRGDIVIGNDVWVGRGAMILSGVKIGDGAVIAARAVISRDVEPYAIVGGNPAKHIRFRFSPEQIAALQRIAWWDWPEPRVDRAVPMLLQGDIDAFIRAVDAGEL